jgi:hypothetical protein
MRHAHLMLVCWLAVGCGAKSFDSLCNDSPPPPACMQGCDPSGANTCPAGFHCASNGTCDAQCTVGGGQCGSGFHCSADGRCIEGTIDDVPEYCKHIDVVIAVDNSGSMREEKEALRDIAFPGFAQALINVAGGIEDFRVGVLDACPNPASFHTRGVGGACNFQSGKVWMESSSTALVDEFKCVGDIDSSGTSCSGSNDDEQPATAATVSLEPAYQGAGMPNAGFMRADALLVVVAITDEDEQPVPNATAQQIYDRLVAVKGDVKKMVFLGIGGASSCNGAYGSADNATKLKATTDLFINQQRGVFWDLCQGNLEQGLALSLQTIDQACRDFPILL